MPHTTSPHPRITASSRAHLARHYNSALSIWLSVDPLADKYPSMSPYTYCANNPVKLVDPDGRKIWIDDYLYTPGQACPEGVADNTLKKWNTLNAIYEKRNGRTLISQMSSNTEYEVRIYSEYNTDGGGSYKKTGEQSGKIYLNGHDDDMGILSHELFHGYQHMNKQFDNSIFNELEANMFSYSITNDCKNFEYDNGPYNNNNEPQQEGINFNSHLYRLLTHPEFNQEEFDAVHDGFKAYSTQNRKCKYDTYSIDYQKKNLIRDFYPLKE